jgi:hypothetical protein
MCPHGTICSRPSFRETRGLQKHLPPLFPLCLQPKILHGKATLKNENKVQGLEDKEHNDCWTVLPETV